MLSGTVRVRVAVPLTLPVITILPVLGVLETEIVVLVSADLEGGSFDFNWEVSEVKAEHDGIRRTIRPILHAFESLTPRKSVT